MALLLSFVAAVSAGVFVLVHSGIIDDAYIDLTYARNLAFHFHWGLIPGETANTATSPLNILLLGAITAVVRHPVVALGILFVLCNMAVGYGLLRSARVLGVPAWSAPLGVGLVLCNPLLDSTVGLEIALSAAVMALMLMAAVEGRAMSFGIFAGLLELTRIDLVIFSVILFAGCPVLRQAWRRVLPTAIAVCLPWFAWSWAVLGSIVPDSVLIKASMQPKDSLAFAKGPIGMWQALPAVAVLAFLPAILGLVGMVAWAAFRMRTRPQIGRDALSKREFRPVILLGVGGVAQYVAYTVLDAPVFHWYYSWPIIR